MALEFLSCVQSALLSTGYYSIILKVKQAICLESLFLKKDLVAVLPTGYGKSLVSRFCLECCPRGIAGR